MDNEAKVAGAFNNVLKRLLERRPDVGVVLISFWSRVCQRRDQSVPTVMVQRGLYERDGQWSNYNTTEVKFTFDPDVLMFTEVNLEGTIGHELAHAYRCATGAEKDIESRAQKNLGPRSVIELAFACFRQNELETIELAESWGYDQTVARDILKAIVASWRLP